MEITNNDITNIMLEVPHGFKIEKDGFIKHYNIYQPSLGMVYINAQIIEQLGINEEMLKKNAIIEILRIVHNRKELCCRYIAYNTFKRKEQLLNADIIEQRAMSFYNVLEPDEIATLIMQIMNTISIADCIKKLGIADDKQQMQRVQRAKKNNNTFVFGGKSVYGALIGSAMEKYHWTYDYVLWGISYANLQLLLADAVTSIYLTDDERKSACIAPPNAKKIKVTAENLAQLKEQFR